MKLRGAAEGSIPVAFRKLNPVSILRRSIPDYAVETSWPARLFTE